MKKTLRLLALLMLVVAMCFAVVSCGGDSTPENTVITNDFGAKLEGGGFDESVTLTTDPVLLTDEAITAAIDKVVASGADLVDKLVAVYDIAAIKDNAKVQPNGKATVSVPAPVEGVKFDVYHILADAVEKLAATTENGMVTFETDSFSPFVFTSSETYNEAVPESQYVQKYTLTTKEPTPNSTITITEALAYANTFANDTYSTGKYHISGKIVEIIDAVYGDVIIADENGKTLLINKSFSAAGDMIFENINPKPVLGDTVSIYGVLGKANGEAQMKNGWLKVTEHEHNYVDFWCACGESDPNYDLVSYVLYVYVEDADLVNININGKAYELNPVDDGIFYVDVDTYVGAQLSITASPADGYKVNSFEIWGTDGEEDDRVSKEKTVYVTVQEHDWGADVTIVKAATIDVYVETTDNMAVCFKANGVTYYLEEYDSENWRMATIETYVGEELTIEVVPLSGYNYGVFTFTGDSSTSDDDFNTTEKTFTFTVNLVANEASCIVTPIPQNTITSAYITEAGGWEFSGNRENGYTTTIEIGRAPTDLEDVMFNVIYQGVDGEKPRTVRTGELTLDKGNYDPNVGGTYVVTFTLVEDTSYVFTVTITVDPTLRYTAKGVALRYEDEYSGVVSIYVDGVRQSNPERIPAGTVVTFKQGAQAYYSFAGWYYLNDDGTRGDFITYDETYTVTLNSDFTIAAYFVPELPIINVTVTNGGTVTLNDFPILSEEVEVLEKVTLVATPKEHFSFVGWYADGELLSTETTYVHTAIFSITIEARFKGEGVLGSLACYIDGAIDKDSQSTVLIDEGDGVFTEETTDYIVGTRFGNTVRIVAKPAEGYDVGRIVVKIGEGSNPLYLSTAYAYMEFTVDYAENYEISVYYVTAPEEEEDVRLYVDFEGGTCDDCYIYLNGIKMTKANSKAITVKDQSQAAIVAVECGHCEGFRYYIHTNGSNAGTVIKGGSYRFTVSTDACKQVTTNFGTEYTLNFDVCFGFETVTLGMFHDEDVVDVVVENAYNSSTGEHVNLENTQDYLFGAVLGETITLKVKLPNDGNKYTYVIEIKVTYNELDAENKVIKTYYIHSDNLDGDYYDLVIEYPGYYEISVSAGMVVN